MSTPAYLEMKNITKTFPGVTALDNVSFSCNLGEVHGLVGENGAGKSTLMNMLGGLLMPDSGTISIDGKTVKINDPGISYKYSIGFVHQESNLLSNLTVYENIFLAREISARFGSLDQNQMRKKVIENNNMLGYSLDPDARVEDLKPAERQLTEISRALMQDPKILIMDEPTASLSDDEVKRLFKIINRLKENGVCIIYISHRLDEIVSLADYVTVLKDGKLVGQIPEGEISKDKMISMMVGRTLSDIYPDRSNVKFGEVLLKVKDLTIPKKAKNISFNVRAGEIVGLGGLEGQGQRDVIRAIFGDVPFIGGTIVSNEMSFKSKNIKKRIKSKLCYVTHDRRGEGLVLHQSIRENVELAGLKQLASPLNFISRKKEAEIVSRAVERLQIKTSSAEQPVATLSGGNQQKVILARWLMVDPKVLIVDEPTKGIDVGARMSVYQILHELTQEGIAVVILTSDMLELIGLSDRTLVFYEGEITAAINRSEATEERLMQAASGIKVEEGVQSAQ